MLNIVTMACIVLLLETPGKVESKLKESVYCMCIEAGRVGGDGTPHVRVGVAAKAVLWF